MLLFNIEIGLPALEEITSGKGIIIEKAGNSGIWLLLEKLSFAGWKQSEMKQWD